MPIILSAVVYDKLPEQIAIHFDSMGNPDNYFPKLIAAFGLPVLLAAFNIIVSVRMDSDPKIENSSSALRTLSKWVIPIISVIIMPITLFKAMGADIPIGMVVMPFTGVLIVICGNYMPKCKQNYTIGIKLPWTLNDEENWYKTHRVSGFLWVVGGVILIILGFINVPYISLAVIVLLALFPAIYSFVLYKIKIKNKI